MQVQSSEKKYRDGVLDVDAPVSVMVLYIVWACIYGFFALRYDTDPEACYADADSDKPLKYPSLHSQDVGQVFRSCFEWFFFLTLGQIAVAVSTHCLKNQNMRQLLFLLMLLSSYAFISFWGYVIYTRFTHEGRVCSGDFLQEGDQTDKILYQQGVFIYVIATFAVSLFSVFCCISSILACQMSREIDIQGFDKEDIGQFESRESTDNI